MRYLDLYPSAGDRPPSVMQPSNRPRFAHNPIPQFVCCLLLAATMQPTSTGAQRIQPTSSRAREIRGVQVSFHGCSDDLRAAVIHAAKLEFHALPSILDEGPVVRLECRADTVFLSVGEHESVISIARDGTAGRALALVASELFMAWDEARRLRTTEQPDSIVSSEDPKRETSWMLTGSGGVIYTPTSRILRTGGVIDARIRPLRSKTAWVRSGWT